MGRVSKVGQDLRGSDAPEELTEGCVRLSSKPPVSESQLTPLSGGGGSHLEHGHLRGLPEPCGGGSKALAEGKGLGAAQLPQEAWVSGRQVRTPTSQVLGCMNMNSLLWASVSLLSLITGLL